jgi:hypothetical protein
MFLEIVQTDGKIMDIHFFENIALEKNLPVRFQILLGYNAF